jgi:hypothetical protein
MISISNDMEMVPENAWPVVDAYRNWIHQPPP